MKRRKYNQGTSDFWIWLLSAAAVGAIVGPSGAAQAQAQTQAPAPAQQADDGESEEIVVTAQKRDERLIEVPVSISVLSGDDLAGPVGSLRDALRTVPGIAGYENFQAAGMTKFSVRGVSSNSSLFNGGAVVGYYFDETPFSFVRFPVSPDLNAYDLERVEVLRGPQGTLYGASSLNGVVRVITRSADLNDFELTGRGTLSSTRDGGENYRADAAVNIPLVPGKLALRAVAGYSDNSGWIDSVNTPERDINGQRDENLRLRLRAAPTDNLDIQLSTWLRRGDGDGYPTSFDNRTWNARTATTPDEPTEMALDTYNATVRYDFPTVSLVSSTSYLTYRNDSNFATSGDLLLTRITAKSFTQELRALSTGDGPWQWSFGGIYRDATDTKYQDFLRNALGANLSAISLSEFKSESYAVFGELTRTFFDNKLKLTAGLRYFHDNTSANEISGFNPNAIVSGLDENAFNATTPRFVITYLPSSNLTFYASYAQGFRSGFTLDGSAQLVVPELSANVRPDRLTNYEIGSHGRTSNGVFSYDVAAYFMDWQDPVQTVNRRLPCSNPGPAGCPGGLFPFNAESASGWGVDLAVTIAPTRGLRFGGTLSWNDLTFDKDVRTGTALAYPAGSRLNESPEWTAGGFLGYDIPFGGGYSGTFETSANYTSKISFGTVAAGQTFGDNLFTARASFALHFPNNLDVTLFVDNLTDEDGAIRYGAFVAGSGDRFRPRTIGLQLDFRM